MLTPLLDRLAEIGVILDSYYTAPRYDDASATEPGGNWGHTVLDSYYTGPRYDDASATETGGTEVTLDRYYTAPRYDDASATETGGNWGHTRQLLHSSQVY